MKQNMQLTDVLNIVWKNRWKIILFTLISAGIGLILTFVLPKKYESNAYFIVRPPAYSMRSSTFSNDHYGEVVYDFFANEKEIDIIDGVVNSGYFIGGILNHINNNLQDFHLEEPITQRQLKSSFKFKRNAQRVQNLRVMASNPQFSEKLSAYLIYKLTESYNEYFQDSYRQKIKILSNQLTNSYEQLNEVDNTIEMVRKGYGLTTELAPYRGQVLVNANNQPVKEGTEQLYNLVQSKDELMQNITLLERGVLQYKTLSQEDHIDMIYIVSLAYVPIDASFPRMDYMLLLGALLGFFVSTLGIVISYIPRNQ